MSEQWVDKNGRWVLGAILSCMILTYALAHGCKSGHGVKQLDCTFERVHRYLPDTYQCLKTEEFRPCLDRLAKRVGEDIILCAAERIAGDRGITPDQVSVTSIHPGGHSATMRARANEWLVYRYSF